MQPFKTISRARTWKSWLLPSSGARQEAHIIVCHPFKIIRPSRRSIRRWVVNQSVAAATAQGMHLPVSSFAYDEDILKNGSEKAQYKERDSLMRHIEDSVMKDQREDENPKLIFVIHRRGLSLVKDMIGPLGIIMSDLEVDKTNLEAGDNQGIFIGEASFQRWAQKKEDDDTLQRALAGILEQLLQQARPLPSPRELQRDSDLTLQSVPEVAAIPSIALDTPATFRPAPFHAKQLLRDNRTSTGSTLGSFRTDATGGRRIQGHEAGEFRDNLTSGANETRAPYKAWRSTLPDAIQEDLLYAEIQLRNGEFSEANKFFRWTLRMGDTKQQYWPHLQWYIEVQRAALVLHEGMHEQAQIALEGLMGHLPKIDMDVCEECRCLLALARVRRGLYRDALPMLALHSGDGISKVHFDPPQKDHWSQTEPVLMSQGYRALALAGLRRIEDARDALGCLQSSLRSAQAENNSLDVEALRAQQDIVEAAIEAASGNLSTALKSAEFAKRRLDAIQGRRRLLYFESLSLVAWLSALTCSHGASSLCGAVKEVLSDQLKEQHPLSMQAQAGWVYIKCRQGQTSWALSMSKRLFETSRDKFGHQAPLTVTIGALAAETQLCHGNYHSAESFLQRVTDTLSSEETQRDWRWNSATLALAQSRSGKARAAFDTIAEVIRSEWGESGLPPTFPDRDQLPSEIHLILGRLSPDSRRQLDQLHILDAFAAIQLNCGRCEIPLVQRIYETIYDGRLTILGSDHPDTLNARSGLASILAMQDDRLLRAEEVLEEVHACWSKRCVEDPGFQPQALRAEADLYQARMANGRASRVKFDTAMRRIIECQESEPGAAHPDTIQSWLALLTMQVQQKQTKSGPNPGGSVERSQNSEYDIGESGDENKDDAIRDADTDEEEANVEDADDVEYSVGDEQDTRLKVLGLLRRADVRRERLYDSLQKEMWVAEIYRLCRRTTVAADILRNLAQVVDGYLAAQKSQEERSTDSPQEQHDRWILDVELGSLRREIETKIDLCHRYGSMSRDISELSSGSGWVPFGGSRESVVIP